MALVNPEAESATARANETPQAANRLLADSAIWQQALDTITSPLGSASALALGLALASRGRWLSPLRRLIAADSDREVISAALRPSGQLLKRSQGDTFGSRFGLYSAARPGGEHFQLGKLPCQDRNSELFQQTISKRLGLDLDKLDQGKIAVLHPRFKNPEKQLLGKIDPGRDLALWGDHRQGVGVVEYKDLQQAQGYLKGAQSVVRIAFKHDATRPLDYANHVGSGVFVGPGQKGLILTNEHVVKGAGELTISTAGGGKFRARVIDANEQLDLAMLKVIDAPAASSFPAATMSDCLEKGAKVIGIGHHGALRGLIASPGRYEQQSVEAFTFDSSMPGMSGGGIFNRDGRLVGIASRAAHSLIHQDRSLVGAVGSADVKRYVSEVMATIINL